MSETQQQMAETQDLGYHPAWAPARGTMGVTLPGWGSLFEIRALNMFIREPLQCYLWWLWGLLCTWRLLERPPSWANRKGVSRSAESTVQPA